MYSSLEQHERPWQLQVIDHSVPCVPHFDDLKAREVSTSPAMACATQCAEETEKRMQHGISILE